MPRPSAQPTIPTSGFDDEAPKGAAPAPVVIEQPNTRPVVKAEAPASEAPPLSLADVMAELARLKAENERLAQTALEALARPKDGAAPEPEVILPTRKLYFTGTRMEALMPGTPEVEMPDLHLNRQAQRLEHVCGRGPMPITFTGSDSDPRPHAFVTEAFGEWLRANDAPRDVYGRVLVPRYEWGDE